MRTRSLWVSLWMGAALATVTHAEAVAPVDDEIGQLLDRLGRSGCQFLRNGTWYDGERAQQHLQRKYRYLRSHKLGSSAEDFIALGATGSSFSGKPYAVQCPGSARVASAAWLTAQLGLIRTAVRKADHDAAAATGGHAPACLRYIDEVTLTGELVRRRFVEQPRGAGQVSESAAYLFVLPATPMCVAVGDPSDEAAPAPVALESVQLSVV